MNKDREKSLNGKGYAFQRPKNQSTSTLNTENKNNFIFEQDGIVINVPGGLNDYKYESLVITVKVNKIDNYRNYRHNVNLYNATHVERLIANISEHLELSVLLLRKAFVELTEQLEQYRFEFLNTTQEDQTAYQLNDDDSKEAIQFLKSYNLMEVTNNRIGASGIIGEEINRLLMYLIFSSRKTNNPLHCISFGSSGVGKTHLQNKVSELMPPEDTVEITQLSANAFYYFKQYELKHKLVLIEDMDGAEDGLLPLRELQTKKRISKSVVNKSVGGRGRTYNQVVEGPVCVSGCTTKESIYEDNSNRSFLLYIDESSEQDERIMHHQRMQYAGKIDIDYQLESVKILRNVQRLLKPVKVINPYAEYLELPKTVFKPRRTNIHYLQLIEVITFYHQFQRERKYDEVSGEEYIETVLEDIQWANRLIKNVLLRKSDRLNKVTRDYHESLTKYLKGKNTNIYCNQEVRREFGINEGTLRRYHKLLEVEGYVRRRNDIKGTSLYYEILDINEFQDLENTIEKALQLCVDHVGSLQVRHQENDEVNVLKNKD